MFDKGILSVEERESRCYEYFHTNCIENREQLREQLKAKPIPEVRTQFVEDIFSDFLLRKKYNQKRANEIKLGTNHEQVFVLSDLHIPYQDDDTLKAVFDCLVDNQPQDIVLLGDVLDCYSISRFCKRPDRVRNLQYEIDIFYKMMRELKKHLPNTDIHYVLGNHENRLEKLVLENPGLFGLKALEPQRLFRLDEQNSSGWFENGCLCKIEPDYLNDPDKANWQHGFTIIDSYDNINQGTQILIQNHSFAYGGKIYK